jgi:cytochrome bd-type quinol oxidase subunit 2
MVKVKTTQQSSSFVKVLSFNKINYIIFAIGIAVIIAGYFIMATEKHTVFNHCHMAPIILLIGYLVIVPLAILYRKRENKTPKEN